MRSVLPPRWVGRSALLLAGLAACVPLHRAGAQGTSQPPAVPVVTSTPPPQISREADGRRLLGTWALSDCGNQLFNLLLRADGSAVAIFGGRTPAGANPAPLKVDALMQQGRWRSWGNGVRVDYGNGWSDTIQIAPGGPIQWSWKPGADRGEAPTNTGKALRISKPELAWVGVYRLWPTQPTLPPYLVTLLSSGQAFNSIDTVSAGAWHQEPDRLVIHWASGWRTVIPQATAPAPGQPLRVLYWAPARDRQGPASAERSGTRL